METFGKMLTQVNWMDILIVLVSVRIIYTGIKHGFIIEFFKLIGVFSALFITFHYYTGLAKILEDHTAVPESFADFLCFGLLWAAVILAFKLIRDGLMLLFKVEAVSLVDQWGGLLLSILRGALTGSLILIFLQVSGMEYWKNNAKKSFFNPYLGGLSPEIYKATYDGMVSKFFPTEKLNLAVFKIKNEKSESKGSSSD